MPDLIFVSMENWDEVWRRNQFLCSSLARRFPDRKILFVGMPWDVTRHLRRGTLRELRKPITWKIPALPNITVAHPLKFFPESFKIGQWLNEWISRIQLRRTARRLRMKQPLLWLNPHSAVHMAGEMGERAVIYDITDDWSLTPCFSEKLRERIKEQDTKLCGLADLVIVCSDDLYRTRKQACRRILLLPNGVNVEHYSKALPAAEPDGLQRPVFGYTGTLHPDRTDVSLIAALADAFPEGTVMLVGPNHFTSRENEILASRRNVVMPGAAPYAQIPEIMNRFDVCIVPHVETPFTESLNPIKLWEYLASGKPIVSSNIAGFRDYAHLCKIASGTEEFVKACQLALRENGSQRAERMSEARRNTWESRVDGLLSALKEQQLVN